jgi:hypothetical protein
MRLHSLARDAMMANDGTVGSVPKGKLIEK